ncbi:MAG: hypothetical protein GX448_02495 [Planctomycetes bacterium]|nr:hypothetical protein [Planctomycetota bacterium]
MKNPYVHVNRVDELPEKAGRITVNVKPDDRPVEVVICGDPDGLRYMASVLMWLADFDQGKNSDPVGSREHLHLMPGEEMDAQSCYVEVCRADAKGTGDLPEFMR